MTRTALVVGAQGVIGRNLVDELERSDGWDVVGVSRRGGEDRDRVRHLRVDLDDHDAAVDRLRDLRDVTHVFYAAYRDLPGWAGLSGPNVAMLRAVLDGVQDLPALEHVSLMQGYKVYGAHLGPFKTPAREDDAGHMPPEFNVEQQELLEARAAQRDWSWSALRPSIVAGFALGNPMNLVTVLAVYATLGRELGVPLRFPGAPGAYDRLYELTDAGLLARATVWAATDPAGRDQAFNVNNGDTFRWRELWPRVAAAFDVAVGDPLPLSLADTMADKAPLWDALVARHDLAPTPYEDVSSWAFGDAIWAQDYDMFADGSKLRRAGFGEHVDTFAMLDARFEELRERRIIPPRG